MFYKRHILDTFNIYSGSTSKSQQYDLFQISTVKVFILYEEEHFLHQLQVHLRGQNQTTHLREEPTVPILLPLIVRCELFISTTVPTNLVE